MRKGYFESCFRRSGDSEQLAAVKDRFPRGGAMGLLDRFEISMAILLTVLTVF